MSSSHSSRTTPRSVVIDGSRRGKRSSAVTSSSHRSSTPRQQKQQFDYSFTAEQPTMYEMASTELTPAILDSHPWSPDLVESVSSPTMKKFFKCGSNVDDTLTANGQNALHLMAKQGLQVYVKVLMSARANLEATDAAGNTALMLACRGGHSVTVSLLVQSGADPERVNHAGQNALHNTAAATRTTVGSSAFDGGVLECAVILLTQTGDGSMSRGISCLDNDQRTPLLLAAMNNHVELALLLLEYDSSPGTMNIQDLSTGQTALHWAVRHNAPELVDRLIELEADVNIRDRQWNTPFTVAVSCRHRDVIEKLVAAGCDMHVTDYQFNTGLHLASRDGVADIVRQLIDSDGKSRGVQQVGDIDVKGHGGVTALMLACQNGHLAVVKELLKAGANPDRVDRHRATALMYSILTSTYSEPCPALIKLLIRYNCNVDEPANVVEFAKFWKLPAAVVRSGSLDDGRMYSPVEMAFYRGQVTTFSILVQAGCDLTHFRHLINVQSGPAFTNCLNAFLQEFPATMTSLSSGDHAQRVAAIIRYTRDQLKSYKSRTSLKTLSVRPALQALLVVARRRHVEITDLIASLSKPNDDVKRQLMFKHLDDDVALIASPITSPSLLLSPKSPSSQHKVVKSSSPRTVKHSISPVNRQHDTSTSFPFSDFTATSPVSSKNAMPSPSTLRQSHQRSKHENLSGQRDQNHNITLSSPHSSGRLQQTPTSSSSSDSKKSPRRLLPVSNKTTTVRR